MHLFLSFSFEVHLGDIRLSVIQTLRNIQIVFLQLLVFHHLAEVVALHHEPSELSFLNRKVKRIFRFSKRNLGELVASLCK